VLGAHAEMIERRFGGAWDQFTVGVMRGSVKARRVLLWYFRMLNHPGYRIEDLPDFYTGELVVSYSVAEVGELRKQAEVVHYDDPDEREQLMAMFDVMQSEAMSDEEARAVAANAGREVDGTEGKALSPSSASDGG
jgi:hypothetical protein